MKAMLLKELRENGRWAALAGFVLFFAELGALMSAGNSWMTGASSLCVESFLLRSVAGCAAIGAFLAILQIARERGRDRWAQLLHRPAAPGALFAGKIAAGLLLAIAATGIPFLASVAYAAWPGHFAAPFVPGLMIPSGSDLLLAPLFYLATALLALHSGPWWGARGAMLCALAGVTYQHVGGGEPFLLPLGSALLFGLAAWGAFRGGSARPPRAARLALGLIVLGGVYAGLRLIGSAGGWAPAFFGSQGFRFPYTMYEVASDGTVLLRRHTDGYDEHSILTDLAGNKVTDEKYLGRNPRVPFLGINFLAYHSEGEPEKPPSVRSAWHYREFYQGMLPEQDLWYLLPAPRNYFVCYDRLSRRRTQICDAEGFKGPDAVPHPFSSESLDVTRYGVTYFYLPIQHRLWTFDFERRKTTPFIDLPDDEFYGAMRLFHPHGAPIVMVALASGVRLYDAAGNLKVTLPAQHDPQLWREVTGFVTADLSHYYLRFSPSFGAIWAGQGGPAFLDEFDGAGHLLTSHSAPTQPESAGRPREKSRGRLLAAMPVVEAAFPRLFAEEDGPPDRMGGMVVALVLALAAWIWGGVAGLAGARRVSWIGATLVLGLPGFIAYRLAAKWATHVACPECARPRPVERAHCPRCGGGWKEMTPGPASIFEPATTV